MTLLGSQPIQIPAQEINELYKSALQLVDSEELNVLRFNYTALIPSAIDEQKHEVEHKVVSIRTLGDIMRLQQLMGTDPGLIN